MIRPDLPPMPPRIAALPISERGYPVPYFVAVIDGKPDFRISDGYKLRQCLNRNLCFVCGQPLGKFKTFPVGPMCTVNRVSSEPPSHLDCSEWSVRACPFLLNPSMTRRDHDGERMQQTKIAGHGIDRNPGVIALWTATGFDVQRVSNGILFNLENPHSVTWWREGRRATRSEVVDSVESGLPLLLNLCENEQDRADVERLRKEAEAFFPAA